MSLRVSVRRIAIRRAARLGPERGAGRGAKTRLAARFLRGFAFGRYLTYRFVNIVATLS